MHGVTMKILQLLLVNSVQTKETTLRWGAGYRRRLTSTQYDCNELLHGLLNQ